ncbi:methyltransferase family protein [Sphingomonas sp. CJ99]
MAKERDHAGVRFPPPLVFLGLMLIGQGLEPQLGLGGFGIPLPGLRIAAGALLALGGAMAIALAITGFRRAGTDPEPWKPTSAIVDGGIYGVTRNPMYLGMALVQAGLGVATDSLLTLVLTLPALAAIRLFVIAREERYLIGRFGQPYRDYMASVPRWL